MKTTVYLLALALMAGSASSAFTAFGGEEYREGETLETSFEVNLGYSPEESYRVELVPERSSEMNIDLDDKVLKLNGPGNRTILMPSGRSMYVKTVKFDARVSPDSLKRNHTFSIDVNVRPDKSSGSGVSPRVIQQRTLEYSFYTRSDQIRENRIESNSYSGEIVDFEEEEETEEMNVSETRIEIRENSEPSGPERPVGSGPDQTTVVLGVLILATVAFILREVVS